MTPFFTAPHSNPSLPQALSSCVLMTHSFLGEAGRGFCPQQEGEKAMCIQSPGNTFPRPQGEVCARGRWEGRPETWTREPALGRAEGQGQGSKPVGSFTDCIASGRSLCLLRCSLPGRGVGNGHGLAVWNGNIPRMKRFCNWHHLRSDVKWSHSMSQIDSMQKNNKPPQFPILF